MTSVKNTLSSILLETSLPITQQQLKSFWAEMDKRYFDEDEGCWNDDKAYGTCTYANQAPFQALTRDGHKVEIWGADEATFKGSYLAELGMITGHDWGVIDDRWIIDVWAHAYMDPDLPVIYDMRNKKDQEMIAKIYPPRDKWVSVYSSTQAGKSDEHHKEWQKSSGEDWDNVVKSGVTEAVTRSTRDEVQAFILKQTGLSLEPCDQLRPSKGYYNFKLKNRASESEELETLLRFLPRQSLIKKVEPNGAQRIAVFV